MFVRISILVASAWEARRAAYLLEAGRRDTLLHEIERGWIDAALLDEKTLRRIGADLPRRRRAKGAGA